MIEYEKEKTEEGDITIVGYLPLKTIKGVGPATAKKIVDTFGDEKLHVLKIEPHRLTKIIKNKISHMICYRKYKKCIKISYYSEN